MTRSPMLRFWYGPLRVVLRLPDDHRREALVEMFGVYESCPVDAGNPDIEIVVDPPRPWEAPLASIGGDHDEYTDGFAARIGDGDACRWRWRDGAVRVELRRAEAPAQGRRRWRRRGSASERDTLGRLIHELALPGAAQMFFPKELTWIPGAAIDHGRWGTAAIVLPSGGQDPDPGAGLANRDGWRFLAGAMVGVDARGHAHFNGAAVRLAASGDRRESLLRRRARRRSGGQRDSRAGALDLLPALAFSERVGWAPLRRLLVGVPVHEAAARVLPISSSVAAFACARLLATRLSRLARHVDLSRFARQILGLPSRITVWGVEDWARHLRPRLEPVACAALRIPASAGTEEILDLLERILREQPSERSGAPPRSGA